MQTKIDFKQAMNILQSQNITTLGVERVFLHDALGRVLAHDIYAESDMPHCALSNMDGYAFNSTFKDAKSFRILGVNQAGNAIPTLPLDAPFAIKTFTGAKIPQNADMLVPIEHCTLIQDTLSIETLPSIGQYMRQAGDNYKKGEKLLSKGTRLNANHIGLLASLNQVFIKVFARPKVGILVSGNELLELGESVSLTQDIYNANGHLLLAKVLENGGIPKLYPILKDDKAQVKSNIECALKECDMVITSGGASVGDYDFITALCKERTKEVIFQGVRIKPGQHIVYAQFNSKHFFGLPGFPNSTLVTFELFVKEILLRLLGTKLKRTTFKIPLSFDIDKNDTRLEFRVCNVRNKEGSFSIDFKDKKDFQSAILNNFCPLDNAQVGLCVLDSAKKSGEITEVILL
ncbi:molybdopterin molybdotransferase MoeA [Helicobacter turcicus]|uniref:Molybdopterin molybdenumtransferase n=1 Tax=Helicobacter turcicus TaxID=2867412 RepID=A0ABS7JPP2_9HELI|nr:molybdopterin molybdotransferase MoeA [Helicobacter turcicus]MBX7491344.1 molybdopterin molybdotransferase MoeA [Helicobacter turcicus]MBX7546169.1 molybdopterin molybdotransferase MoeA [Helicobacter turcicus]